MTMLIVALSLLSAQEAKAQTTIAVTDASSTFTPITANYGSYMQDPSNDQQTGHASADFVGTAGSSGFLIKTGTFANGEEMMVIRFTFREYRTQGFQANLRLGIDANADGAVDLYFGPSYGGNSNGIYFQDPTGGANISPSTSSLTSDYGDLSSGTETPNAFVESGANATYSYVDTGISGAAAQLTFAISFEALAGTLLAKTGISITPDSFVRFIAFTSTQSNAINRDIYGLNGGLSSTVRFDAPGGGFTDYVDSSGNPVPELSSFAYAAGLILSAFARRPRRRAVA